MASPCYCPCYSRCPRPPLATALATAGVHGLPLLLPLLQQVSTASPCYCPCYSQPTTPMAPATANQPPSWPLLQPTNQPHGPCYSQPTTLIAPATDALPQGAAALPCYSPCYSPPHQQPGSTNLPEGKSKGCHSPCNSPCYSPHPPDPPGGTHAGGANQTLLQPLLQPPPPLTHLRGHEQGVPARRMWKWCGLVWGGGGQGTLCQRVWRSRGGGRGL